MTGHVKNIVIALIISALALTAGIKGYVHHQFKTNIDNTLSGLRALADIRYSDISTSVLSGTIKLENVRVSNSFIPGTLNLGDITFETPGFSYMLSGPKSFENEKFDVPEKFGIAIKNFNIDLNSEIAEWLDKIVNRIQPIYATERKICGGKSIYSPSDYKEMGYSRLNANIHMAYDINKKNITTAIMTVQIKNMGKLNLKIVLSNLSNITAINKELGGIPKLSNIEITYHDDSYFPHILKYCSDLDKTTKEEFINAEIKQSNEYFYMLWGFAPGYSLRDAYKDFLLKPDNLLVTMRPSEGFSIYNMSHMTTNEIMDGLNVQLKVNGLLVTDVGFTKPPVKFYSDFKRKINNSLNFNSLLNGGPIETEKPVVVQKPVKKRVAGYHVISLNEAPQHITDFVIITTKQGSIRKGQLMRITKTNLYVQKKVSGGKFTMTVPRSEVKKIEAYFTK